MAWRNAANAGFVVDYATKSDDEKTGLPTQAEYEAWIDGFAAGIGDREAIVILGQEGLLDVTPRTETVTTCAASPNAVQLAVTLCRTRARARKSPPLAPAAHRRHVHAAHFGHVEPELLAQYELQRAAIGDGGAGYLAVAAHREPVAAHGADAPVHARTAQLAAAHVGIDAAGRHAMPQAVHEVAGVAVLPTAEAQFDQGLALEVGRHLEGLAGVEAGIVEIAKSGLQAKAA